MIDPLVRRQFGFVRDIFKKSNFVHQEEGRVVRVFLSGNMAMTSSTHPDAPR